MSRHEWKPGDVARIELANGIVHPIALRLPLHEGGWATPTVKYVHSVHVVDARPLVVIDPEDREAARRLLVALLAQPDPLHPDGSGVMLAIHALANPTPPKPEEPTGLGAVVEDAEGDRWVRYAIPGNTAPWVGSCVSVEWDDVPAVRVLSEGVTA